jgi:hypothetical protein
MMRPAVRAVVTPLLIQATTLLPLFNRANAVVELIRSTGGSILIPAIR